MGLRQVTTLLSKGHTNCNNLPSNILRLVELRMLRSRVTAILDNYLNMSFSVKTITKKDFEKEILNLNVAEASQD